MESDAPALAGHPSVKALIESDPHGAVEQLRTRLTENPLDAEAYRLLACGLKAVEAREGATGDLRVSPAELQLRQAAQAIEAKNAQSAAEILGRRLRQKPDDASALRMMAHVARLEQRDEEEATLLQLALEIRPNFTTALYELALAYDRQKRHPEAIERLDEILRSGDRSPKVLYLRATELIRAGRFEEGATQFEELTRTFPDQPEFWISYGHVLKTLGKRGEAVAAFRRALVLSPTLGVAWWSLSELKSNTFDSSDIEAMTGALALPGPSDSDRLHLHFALGKAFEDRTEVARAFAHYSDGNRLRRSELAEERTELVAYLTAAHKIYTREFFREREGSGAQADDPIFIVGMTRAGSTLIEQILSSHPEIEGTMELPDMPQLAKQVSRSVADTAEKVAALTREQLEEIGRSYLTRTRTYRVTGRPFFVDKMPNNWMHVPLIHLALPNARIIDARRHPMACCFSNFKQHFAVGQAFSNDLADVGWYYSQYAKFMNHVDAVLPGRVYRVFHERLVDDPEAEIRRMLDHLGLPFDEACLRFHENKRAVRTASSEQVRRPINREGVDAWRAFEPWLSPLKNALGPVLDSYPEVPDFSD